jgi:hypothetical protein
VPLPNVSVCALQHELQKMRPQTRQWCLRRNMLNGREHVVQIFAV